MVATPAQERELETCVWVTCSINVHYLAIDGTFRRHRGALQKRGFALPQDIFSTASWATGRCTFNADRSFLPPGRALPHHTSLPMVFSRPRTQSTQPFSHFSNLGNRWLLWAIEWGALGPESYRSRANSLNESGKSRVCQCCPLCVDCVTMFGKHY